MQSINFKSNYEQECLSHMHANGINFDGPLKSDGELHRFSMDAKMHQQDEWYICYEGVSQRGNAYLVCVYGSWSFGQQSYIFKSYETGHTLSSDELAEIKSRERERTLLFEKQREEDQKERLTRAQESWEQAVEESILPAHHAYLNRKQVNAYGIRYRVEWDGSAVLVIPLRNIEGEFQAIQCIHEDGTKRIYGVKKSHFHVIGTVEDDCKIFIAEGYATAASIHEATESPVVIAFDCGNLDAVVGAIKTRYPKHVIIIAGDDDSKTAGNPGRTKAEAAAGKHGCDVIFPSFPQEVRFPGVSAYENSNSSSLTDFNDLRVLCGIAEVKQQLLAVSQAKERPKSFHFRLASQLIQEPPKPNWLIKSYLDRGSFGELFGEPGCMKTFLALDMGLCVATGRSFHGSPVRQSGTVFYIAGEGFAGLSKRLHAWEIDSGIALDGVPFFVSDRPAQFLDEDSAKEVSAAIDELRAEHGNPVFVIIDTLNRNFGPGDENVTSDMTKFIHSVDSNIRLRYGCAVLIVHHSPLNDSGRGRGASALRGALDWEYCITKVDNLRKLSNKKVKDHEPPPDIFFTPQTILLMDWIDQDDDEMMTSCVLKRTNGASQKRDKRLSASQKIAYDCLVKLIAQTDDSLAKGVHIDAWRKATYEAGISASANPDTKKKAFQRAVKDLRDKNCIEVIDDYYSLSGTWDKDGTSAGHVSG